MTGILEVFGYLVCQTQLTKRNILCKHNTNNCSNYISALQLLNCGEHCVINNADFISALLSIIIIITFYVSTGFVHNHIVLTTLY